MTKAELFKILKDVPDYFEIICLVDIADLKLYDEIIINHTDKVVVLQVNTSGK